MADLRTNKAIADRVDITFDRRANQLLRNRRLATWLVALVSLLLVGYFLWRDDKTVYWAGNVSVAHQLHANDCKRCHDVALQPLRRLATLDNDHASVSVEACRSCHADYHADDHHANIHQQDRDAVDNCVTCHREHRSEATLSRVATSLCTHCHADLKVDQGTPGFATSIASFDEHPEFRLNGAASALQHETQHGAIGSGQAIDQDGKWIDTTPIRFNHKLHLAVEGIPVPPGPNDRDDATQMATLQCGDCHQPDHSGQYMQPISYENHCQRCHTLQYASEVASSDRGFEPLPHENMDLVRGVLRERLMTYAEANPDRILVEQPANNEPRHPNKRATTKPAAKDKWSWVEKQLEIMQKNIRAGTETRSDNGGAPAELATGRNILARVKYGCSYCHQVESAQSVAGQEAGTVANWQIVPPNIPDRWQPHSDFDHGRHTQLRCIRCHDPLASTAPDAVLRGELPPEHVLNSEQTADILMPSVGICKSCHSPNHDRPHANGQARDDCVECHKYHHPTSYQGVRPPAGATTGAESDISNLDALDILRGKSK